MKTSILVVIGLIATGCDVRELDTPKEHQERLACEMNQMAGGGMNNRPMAAADAEAYCSKQMEAQELWNSTHKVSQQ